MSYLNHIDLLMAQQLCTQHIEISRLQLFTHFIINPIVHIRLVICLVFMPNHDEFAHHAKQNKTYCDV